MNSRALATPQKQRSGLQGVWWGGFICGCMDITAAFVVYGFWGARPIPLLQGIAGGLLGPRTLQGGLATAFLGLLCHFFIAFAAAGIFWIASRGMRFLVDHAVVSGVLYGVCVYFFMNRVVVPLSAAAKHRFSLEMMLVGVAIHMVCVGLPISLAVRRYSV